ncbi:hypothetical protein PN836_011205 [Ningiella sp. W23]|uniref:hypothetical protein n=1 Tax=Ningiella sp. W23 TaxID=3023715 RepID=UPI0037580A0A
MKIRNTPRFWTLLHKWIGIVIGIQLLLWIAGGLYMSAVPLNWVHGTPLLNNTTLNQVRPPSGYPISINVSDYQSIEWVSRLGKPVLKTTDSFGVDAFFEPQQSARSFALVPLPLVSEREIRAQSIQRYAGSGSLVSVSLLDSPPPEASGITEPVYRVNFDDWINTSFYMHRYTGEVLKVRSDLWRLFDIFWMLHIMDYESREDFNNPLLILSAVIALFFTVTGMMLVFFWLKRGRQSH